MVETHISPKGINRGGFPQNHVVVDGDDMAVHGVGSQEQTKMSAKAFPSASSWVNEWFGCNTDDSREQTYKRGYGGMVDAENSFQTWLGCMKTGINVKRIINPVPRVEI